MKKIDGRFRCLLGLAVLLQLCACASQIPAWIDNPATQYPDQQYLSATGEADQRQTAADRALANIAKIFEVDVSESTLDFSSAVVSSGAEGGGRAMNNG